MHSFQISGKQKEDKDLTGNDEYKSRLRAVWVSRKVPGQFRFRRIQSGGISIIWGEWSRPKIPFVKNMFQLSTNLAYFTRGKIPIFPAMCHMRECRLPHFEIDHSTFLTDPTHHDKLTYNMQNDLSIKDKAELTEREQEILRLVATGTSNKEIARQLVISSNTVKVHLRNIFAKIGAESRTEAAMYAVHTGLVQGAILPPDTITSTAPIEAAPRRGWLSHRWIAMVLVILALGLAGGTGIFLTQRSTTLPLVTAMPSPTTPSRWKILAPMPTARSGLAVAVYENKIYAIGGEIPQGVTGVVESYDPETNSWQKKSSKPLPVSDVEAAVIGGKIFVAGGLLPSGKVTDTLEIYDPRQDRWEQGSALPIALSAYASVAFEGRLYLFGGWNGKQYMNTVYVYDPSRDAWLPRTPMPTPRGFAGAAVLDEKIVVVGGYNGTSALSTSEVYYPERDQGADIPWGKAASLPEGRYLMGVSNLTDMLYLVGGKGNAGTPLSPLLYIPQANSWESFEVPPLSIANGPGLVTVGNYIYVLGGRNAMETSNYTLAYQAVYTIMIPSLP